VPQTFFDAYFSGRYAQDVCKDGSIFVDRDGKHFGHVLEYMREGVVQVSEPGAHPSILLLRALKREFGFYCIELCAEQPEGVGGFPSAKGYPPPPQGVGGSPPAKGYPPLPQGGGWVGSIPQTMDGGSDPRIKLKLESSMWFRLYERNYSKHSKSRARQTFAKIISPMPSRASEDRTRPLRLLFEDLRLL
jgi:hypothetical protein